MEISNQKKLSKHIFRLLKVTDITYPIGRTSKGNLGIRFSENGEDFDIMLDSIPLSTKDIMTDDNNIELKKMLEKYLFDLVTLEVLKVPTGTINKESFTGIIGNAQEIPIIPPGHVLVEETSLLTPKRRGRPAGSKNAPKEINTSQD